VAYDAAQSGDVVGVTGTLGEQRFAGASDGAQPAGTKTLTIHGVTGNAVRMIHFGSPGLTFDGLNIDGNAQRTSNDTALLENNESPFTFKNGAIGNVVDDKAALPVGSGIVFDNVRFHDAVLKTAGVHMECVFIEIPEGLVIRNSTFSNCAVMDLFFVYPDWWYHGPAYGHVTLEGNHFGAPVPPNGSVYVGGTGPNGDTTAYSWKIRNNTFDSAGVWGPMDSSVMCGNAGSVDASWKAPC